MKKLITVLFVFAFLLSSAYAQTSQVSLTTEAKTALIVKLKARLDDLMNQLILLKTRISQQQTNPQLIVPSSTLPNLSICNSKSWLSCPDGQNFFCPGTGDAQCIVTSIPRLEVPQSTLVQTPTPEQLKNLERLCLLTPKT